MVAATKTSAQTSEGTLKITVSTGAPTHIVIAVRGR